MTPIYIDFESCVVVYSWSSKMIQSGIDVIILFSSDEPRAVSATVWSSDDIRTFESRRKMLL